MEMAIILKEDELELLKSLHDFYTNLNIEQKEKKENILIKYLKNKQIIKDSDSLTLFIQELSKQIEKGNNIILPFIDPCYDLIEAYINCNIDKEKEIFPDNSIFKKLIENSFINRKNLIPIYSYFTEIYSEVDDLTEKDEKINKFQKISNLWNLFYSLNEDKTKADNSFSSFCFIGSGLKLSGIKNLPENITLFLKVDFLNSKFKHYINSEDYLISSESYQMEYSNIIDLNIENLTSIGFIIADKKIKININKFPIEQGGPLNADEVNILNNFYGQIKSFELKFYKKKSDNSEEEIYSKSIFPFPLKNNNVIFKSIFQIEGEKFLAKRDNKNKFQISIKLKGQDSDLIKVNYINYKEEKFNIIDYFGGIVQFLPFVKIINGLYRNNKILDKIGKVSFLIDFLNNILLIIFNYINKSGLDKQENFKVYWNFYFYILNKIEIFKDVTQQSIDKDKFVTDNLDGIKSYIEMFRGFLDFIISKTDDIQTVLKNKFSEAFVNEKEEVTNIIRSPQLYRHLMKQLFIYNRLWSKKYLFFDSFPGIVNDKGKKIKIKYKRINNYTCNFQQPLIYPILEINKYYPNFKKFALDKLYKKDFDKNILNYDFSLDIYNNNMNDESIENYLDINLDINKKMINKKQYFCCLIKKMYHIKGEIRAISSSNSKSKVNIIFIPNLNQEGTCNNNTDNNKKNDNSYLCYGSVFKCLEKEKNRLLVIPLDKILFVLLRIYYYRNSGLEIYTLDNKSYYFNFWEDLRINKTEEIIQIFNNNLKLIKDSGNKILGWFNNDYIDLLNPLFNEDIFSWDKKKFFYSNFDKLMIINIFSNRSFNDLYQYPVFPMLYNEIELTRNLAQPIGFQELNDESKERKQLIIDTYNAQESFYEENNDNEEPYYFNLMYSNIIYTCNYLIRVFPYSFIAIEYQGDGFDDPNRLFYSINSTFLNTLSQRGDFRELIPEIFYFPPLFYNKNNIELYKISNGNEIDLVNIENFNEGGSRKYSFLRDMRQYLNEAKINSWIDLIFGVKKDFFKNNGRYYKKHRNISFKVDTKNTNNNLLMQEYDFGVLPIQSLKKEFPENPTISEALKKEINTLNKRKFNEDHINCLTEGKESFICKGEKGINKDYLDIINKIQIGNKSENIFGNKNKEVSDNNTLKYLFVGDVFGNLSVYKKVKDSKKFDKVSNSYIKEISSEKIIINEIENLKNREYELIKSLNDHTSEIKFIDYNPRLNLVVDYGLDGFINLYTMPQLKLVLSIQINEPLNYVVLMSNPFPMICCISPRQIIIFDINGVKVNTINIEENAKLSFNIDKNCGLYDDYISHINNEKESIFPLIPDKDH